jgi:acetylornithine/succinyldiaminopimelate/putrescine aminotransferase
MAKVFFSNSGAEANETALKVARKHTRRARVVAMNGSFHGRTLGALSVTGIPKYRQAFPENLAHLTSFVDLGDLDALRALPAEEIAAVIVEPIQSVAGVYMAPPEYYRELRSLCTERGFVLIFDEVQTGSGRTGKWYAGEHWGVEPDIVTTAKGVGGGFPVGAVIFNRKIAAGIEPADQASTFGGGPLAAACVAATYRILIEEDLPGKVTRLSAMVVERLRALAGRGLVREVRGLGYLLGVECERSAAAIGERLRERGILVGASGQANTFRLLPPLTMGEREWEEFLEAFASVARES